VTGVEVPGGELDASAVVEFDLDRPPIAVDGADGAAAPVGNFEAAVVAGAEDAVADGELGAAAEAEAVVAEAVFAVEEDAGAALSSATSARVSRFCLRLRAAAAES
jgi:hypothetical protein